MDKDFDPRRPQDDDDLAPHPHDAPPVPGTTPPKPTAPDPDSVMGGGPSGPQGGP